MALLSASWSLGPPWKSTFFISAWLDLSFTGVGSFLAGLFTFLSRQPIVSWLRAARRNWFRTNITTTHTKKGKVFCVVFRDINMMSCEMWLLQHGNEQWETSDFFAAGNWCRQWTTTDPIRCHPPWPSSCQSWYVPTTDFTHTPTSERQKQWVWDC